MTRADALPARPASHRGKCIQPEKRRWQHRFARRTHAVEKQRIVGAKVFCTASSAFTFVLPRRRRQRERSGRRRPPARRRVELTDEGSFGKVARHLARENIAGYPSWTLIKRGLRGVSSSRYGLSRWVTQGSMAPGGALAARRSSAGEL